MENKLVLFLLLFSPLVSCGQKSKSLDEAVKKMYENTVPLATPSNVQEWKSAHLLDAREPVEFEVSHLSGAKLVGYDDFDLSSVSGISQSDTIIVYCSVGYRSERIGEKLQEAGFEHVFNLYGGIFNWVNKNGITVDTENDTTQRVHAYNKLWGLYLTKGEKVY